LRINARVRGKLDSGFKRSREELGKTNTNQLGLAMPMLATPMANATFDKNNSYIQPKLDGHRCLINEDGAYSRRGKVINTIPEILKSLDIPMDITLDGELYCHGVPLQTISSWAKKRQKETLNLKFCVYDAIIPGLTFEERNKVLREIVKENEYVQLVDTVKYDPRVSVEDHWYSYRTQGYEGAIVRPADGLYEIGLRSKKLIKVKMRHETEFRCIDVEASRDGYGILILETKEGKQFKTFAPGTYTDKERALVYKERIIGKYVTCEYADLTKEGIPFHCVAIRWRYDL
jgi:DNA ligase-1